MTLEPKAHSDKRTMWQGRLKKFNRNHNYDSLLNQMKRWKWVNYAGQVFKVILLPATLCTRSISIELPIESPKIFPSTVETYFNTKTWGLQCNIQTIQCIVWRCHGTRELFRIIRNCDVIWAIFASFIENYKVTFTLSVKTVLAHVKHVVSTRF